MTDERTRRVMQANGSKDTQPELALRRELHTRGLRYRVNRRIVVDGFACRPDVVFPRQHVAVFVDGCFWHACPTHYSPPKTNVDFWAEKVDRNLLRDRRTDFALEEAGWAVVRVWEHEGVHPAADRVERAVRWTPGGGCRYHHRTSCAGSCYEYACCAGHPVNSDDADVWTRPMFEVLDEETTAVFNSLVAKARTGAVCLDCLVTWRGAARCWSCGRPPLPAKGPKGRGLRNAMVAAIARAAGMPQWAL